MPHVPHVGSWSFLFFAGLPLPTDVEVELELELAGLEQAERL